MMLSKSDYRSRHWLAGAIALAAMQVQFAGFCPAARAVDDVLLQTLDGKIVTGVVDHDTFVGSLGQRVHRQQFLQVSSNFRSSNPGFVSFATGSANMPPGAAGFPANHDVSFDLVPMTIGQVVSNLFYWNGTDTNGNGLDLTDVNFTVPMDTAWDVFDANFNVFTASGTDQIVPGGLIQRTSSDIGGTGSGSIHKHLVLQVRNTSISGPATEGVYTIAWQVRSVGFETSDPFFFVMRTPGMTNTARDLAADWIEAHLEMLTSPPALPGDFNLDGLVDAADYVAWRKTLNGANSYATWRENFGAGEGNGTNVSLFAVAEPGTALLFAAMISVALAMGPRRGWRYSRSGPR